MSIFRVLVLVTFLLVLVTGGVVYGFLSGADKNSFLNSTVFRIERKIAKILERPTPEAMALAVVESTFIRFRGTLYPLPNTDYINGGGMTVAGDTLLVMPRNGRIYVFDDDKGLTKTEIRPPENGFAAYVAASKTEKYENYRHKPAKFRFNDVLYAETPEFKGLLLSYSYYNEEKECYTSRLASFDVPGDANSIPMLDVRPDDWRVVFETVPCIPLNPDFAAMDGMMAGGRMDIGKDGRVVLGVGEYHLDGIHTRNVGIMDKSTSYGKVHAVDPVSGESEIIAIGHRNLQGVAVDTAGEIWTVEHAIRGGDELNHIRDGENAGWPRQSLGTLYSGQPLPVEGVEGRHDLYDQPSFAWLPSPGASALTAIDNFHPAWDGGLVAGSLSSARYGQSLFHIRTEGERVVFVERIALERRVRYVTQFGNRLAVWLDPTDLLILEQVPRADPLGGSLKRLKEDTPEAIVLQVSDIIRTCNECHSFEQFNHVSAPSLNGVVGRRAGSTDFEGYSDAILGLNQTWSKENLAAYLAEPEDFAPGSTMPAQDLERGEVLDALIRVLDGMNTTDDEHLKYN